MTDIGDKVPVGIKTMGDFIKVLNAESPRGRVIVAHAYLDEQLREILHSFMNDSKVTNEILRRYLESCLAKISFCFSLGLIDEFEFNTLESINTIRNKVAHNWQYGLDRDPVKELIDHLPGTGDEKNDKDPQIHFSMVVAELWVRLVFRPKNIQKERRGIRAIPPRQMWANEESGKYHKG